jgi:tetratricopeptide (TPR) repeat protein
MLECLSSWHTHFEAGNFYHSLNNYSKAKDNYEQALKFEIGRSAKAGTLSNLGNIYTQLERFIDAEDTYNQALAIRRDLAKDNPNLLYALSFLLTTIGALKNINLRFSDAEKDLEESLRILRGLGEGNIPFHYHHGIAKNLVTLGNVYTNNRNFQKSERAFLNALTIFDKLLIIEPKARDFLLDSKAGCLNNLGLLYKNTNHNKESIETYSQALPIYRMLAEPNPQAHNPHLALLLSNLGTAHGNRDNFSEAVEFLTESLEIRRALTSINSQAHSSEVAETLNNLAIIYKKTGQFDKAESSYQEAIDIYKLLIADNPQIYQLELAGTAVNMAIFYIDSSPSRDKSLSLLKEAICNAYPYINTVPIANNYISTALWVVGRWNINTNTFFTDAIKEISLLHKNFSTSLKSSSTTYTVRYSSNNLSSSG